MGNGYDTLFLARHTPDKASVWAFDIQAAAVANTKRLLAEHALGEKVRLVEDCHSRVNRYVQQPIDIAMFNLGYLPGSDHSITTSAATTVEALQQIFVLLAVGGLVSIVAYPGHLPGREEHEAVHCLLKKLPQSHFTVGHWQMVNQKNHPPEMYLVEKVKGGKHEVFTSGKD
jgi:threonine dehydrogenase-like Zn-dependent dehydrogenase